jgi:hypothetical protein
VRRGFLEEGAGQFGAVGGVVTRLAELFGFWFEEGWGVGFVEEEGEDCVDA